MASPFFLSRRSALATRIAGENKKRRERAAKAKAAKKSPAKPKAEKPSSERSSKAYSIRYINQAMDRLKIGAKELGIKVGRSYWPVACARNPKRPNDVLGADVLAKVKKLATE